MLLSISLIEASAIRDLLKDLREGYLGLEEEIEEAINILETIIKQEGKINNERIY